MVSFGYNFKSIESESESQQSSPRNSVEEDKDFQVADDSENDILIGESCSESEPKQQKQLEQLRKRSKQSKHKISKRKFEGPAPSKHGINMNERGNSEDEDAFYYQNPQKGFDKRMNGNYPRTVSMKLS